jgi:putative copper resistance protein D
LFLFPLALLVASFLAAGTPAHSDNSADHSAHQHDGMSMPMDMSMNMPLDPAAQAKLLADKRESEFNHHLAGFFVLMGGLIILAERESGRTWLRFAWPLIFGLAGLFLLVWSDTELWPFGTRAWSEALAHSSEVLQHKTYAVILLVLAVIELQKVRGRLSTVWAAWVFPALAIGGSVLLLFHMHDAGMHGADHMEVMARIQSEHAGYAIAGVGIGLSKAFSETRSSWQPFFQRLWPALMMVLGALLMTYVE